VRLADGSGPWLADVGFGSHSTYPLRHDSRHEQHDPGGRFSLPMRGRGRGRAQERGAAVPDRGRGAPAGRLRPHPLVAADPPDSHFIQSTICSRSSPTTAGSPQRQHADPDQRRIAHRKSSCRPTRPSWPPTARIRDRPGPGPPPRGRQTDGRETRRVSLLSAQLTTGRASRRRGRLDAMAQCVWIHCMAAVRCRSARARRRRPASRRPPG
jgi:hypothetical protein